MGVNNTLLCPSLSDLAKKTSPYAKIKTIKMHSDLDLNLLLKIIRIFKAEKPDIVHLHSRRIAEFTGGIAAKICGTPSILTRRVDNKELFFIAKPKYMLYDHIITISDAIKKVLVHQGVSHNKISCIKSAVDSDLFLGDINKISFRKKNNLATDSFLVGMIAQFIPRKGHAFIINIVNDLLTDYKNLHIFFYGQGPLSKKMKKIVFDLGIHDHFHFMGFVSDLDSQIGALDMIVHPAEKEGLGVSLLQGLSSRVPIVANNVGGIPEVVKDGVNGFLVPVGDHQKMKESMKKLIINNDLRKKFGHAGRELIKNEFSIESMAEGNMNIYKKFIN